LMAKKILPHSHTWNRTIQDFQQMKGKNQATMTTAITTTMTMPVTMRRLLKQLKKQKRPHKKLERHQRTLATSCRLSKWRRALLRNM
jgi:hypothetical protein